MLDDNSFSYEFASNNSREIKKTSNLWSLLQTHDNNLPLSLGKDK